jgi:hypothetical protein
MRASGGRGAGLLGGSNLRRHLRGERDTALNASCPKQAPAALTGDRNVSCGIGNSDAMVAYCASH